MECLPGGLCIFLNEREGEPGERCWYYKLYHATEGILEIPDYYFISLDEAYQMGYTVKTYEEEVPNDWETTPYGEQR